VKLSVLVNIVGVTTEHSNAKSDKEINKSQFYQALVDSISARLVPESEKQIAQCLDVLFPAMWLAEVCAEYVCKSCTASKFLVPYSRELKDEYRDFKDVKEAAVSGHCLKRLVGAVHTLPVSTAECERGFSTMNIICMPLTTRLTVKHISVLLFISINGPLLS